MIELLLTIVFVGFGILLPWLLALSLIEVLASPLLVPLLGYGWLQLAAFRSDSIQPIGEAPVRLVPPLAAVAVLLAFFQLVLRPGISF